MGQGRKKKQEEISQLILNHRVVVLEAIGGIGKSTLALDVAENFLRKKRTFDAIIWISAKDAEIDFDYTLTKIAQVLDYYQYISSFDKDDYDSKSHAILQILQDKKVLFIFDNFETITDKQVKTFIQSIPDPNRILVTTRHSDDFIISQDLVKPEILALDKEDGREVIYNALKQNNLLDAATEENISRIHIIADGLPQAMIWVVGQLSCGQTITAIEEVVKLGKGDVFEKLFALSWGMLDESHKEILRAMLFFVKPVSYDALLAATNLATLEFSNALTKLVRLSIIDANKEIEEKAKFYSMHRWAQFFSRKALSYGDKDEIAHALNLSKYYVDFCGVRHDKKNGLQDYEELEYELPNMIKTIRIIEKNNPTKKEENQRIIDFAKAINVFLWSRGFWRERIDVCQMALNAAKRLINNTKNAAKQNSFYAEAGRQAYYIGIVFFWQGKQDEAEKWANESMNYMQKIDSELDLMLAERLSALVKMGKKDANAPEGFIRVLSVLKKYRETNREGVAIFADWIVPSINGHRVGEVALQQEIGICYNKQKKYADARLQLEESKILAKEIQDDEGLSVSLSHLGHSHYGLGELKGAKRCYEQGLFHARVVQRKSTMARCYEGLAKIHYKKNKKKLLIRYGRLALDLFERLGMTDEHNELIGIFNEKKITLPTIKGNLSG